MAACYPNKDLSISQGFTAAVSVISQQHHHMSQVMKKTRENLQRLDQSSHVSSGVAASAVATLSAVSVANLTAAAKNYISTSKDYFVPLHVDCSVEYELPKQPKPPAGQRVEPLLMIHPCYFRKMESQRRSPFINNMPNSSRNGAATFVGVALISQDSNITPTSASKLSLKRSSVKNHQHHYHIRQNVSLQYNSFSHSDQQQQLHQLHTPHQHKPHYNLSLESQQAHFPVASAKFMEHSSTPIRRTSIARSTQSSHHILCSTQQTKNESNQQSHTVQKSSSKSTSSQWDQLTSVRSFVKSSINDQNSSNISSASINNLCEAAGCSTAASSKLGKHDAMISGSAGYSTNSTAPSNNISLETNKNSSNNITSSGKQHNAAIVPSGNSYGISTSLVDRTKFSWNPKTNTTSSLYMIAQSPIAAVPSNFQAGPDTPTTAPLQNKYKTINDNNNENGNKNNVITSGKFRQYIKSQRVHPYLTGTYLHSDSASLSLASKSSALATRGNFQVVPQFSAAKTAVAGVSTATSFQQHMQQISCYNV